MFKVKNIISECFRNSLRGDFFCRFQSFLGTCKRQEFQYFNLFSIYLTLVYSSLQGKYFKYLQNTTTPRRFREWNDRPGFSSFLVTFFFSFHKVDCTRFSGH